MINKIFISISVFFIFSIAVFSKNAGDNVFNSSEIHNININFSQVDYWEQLKNNYESTKDKDTSIFIVADITIDSVFLDSIGVRLKGASSYDHKGLKKPLKLSFNEFISGQSFDGLKQLNLNNGFMDPTMMREKLMLDFLNEKKLPAPRCTYAAVHFNGSYIGLYKIVEEVDKKFLKKYFGNNNGNLYKGDPNGTLEWKGEAQWQYYDAYDLKTNETKNDWSNLLQFISEVNNSPIESFKHNTDEMFNTLPFIRAWAANNLFVNLDSYFYLPHNYFLYHNSFTNKFEWITWDVNVSFGIFPFFSVQRAEKLDVLYFPKQKDKRPLTYNMLETEDYRKEYLNSICEFLYNDFTEIKLFPKIDSIANLIRPWIQKEPDGNQMFTEDEFEKNISDGMIDKLLYDVPGLKSFITNRRKNVIKNMCELNWSCIAGSSIENSLDQVVNVFPNPASIEVTVEINIIEPESRTINYKIVNLTGQTIYTESAVATASVYTHKLSTDKLISGIYILSTTNGCISYNKKIVVIK